MIILLGIFKRSFLFAVQTFSSLKALVNQSFVDSEAPIYTGQVHWALQITVLATNVSAIHNEKVDKLFVFVLDCIMKCRHSSGVLIIYIYSMIGRVLYTYHPGDLLIVTGYCVCDHLLTQRDLFFPPRFPNNLVNTRC